MWSSSDYYHLFALTVELISRGWNGVGLYWKAFSILIANIDVWCISIYLIAYLSYGRCFDLDFCQIISFLQFPSLFHFLSSGKRWRWFNLWLHCSMPDCLWCSITRCRLVPFRGFIEMHKPNNALGCSSNKQDALRPVRPAWKIADGMQRHCQSYCLKWEGAPVVSHAEGSQDIWINVQKRFYSCSPKRARWSRRRVNWHTQPSYVSHLLWAVDTSHLFWH